jgi:hypothetical protein
LFSQLPAHQQPQRSLSPAALAKQLLTLGISSKSSPNAAVCSSPRSQKKSMRNTSEKASLKISLEVIEQRRGRKIQVNCSAEIRSPQYAMLGYLNNPQLPSMAIILSSALNTT